MLRQSVHFNELDLMSNGPSIKVNSGTVQINIEHSEVSINCCPQGIKKLGKAASRKPMPAKWYHLTVAGIAVWFVENKETSVKVKNPIHNRIIPMVVGE